MEIGANLGAGLDQLMPLEKGKGREAFGVDVNALQASIVLAREKMQEDYGVSPTDINIIQQIMTSSRDPSKEFAHPASTAYRLWLKGWHGPEQQAMTAQIHDRRVKLPDPVKKLKERQDEFAGKVFELLIAQEAVKEISRNGREPNQDEVKRLVAQAKGEEVGPTLLEPMELKTEPDEPETFGEYAKRTWPDFDK